MDPTECGSLLSAIRCQECISNGKEETEGKVNHLLNIDLYNFGLSSVFLNFHRLFLSSNDIEEVHSRSFRDSRWIQTAPAVR